MRRGYKSADYLRRVEPVLNSKRNIALTSDIIVGFPGESDQDFEDTLKLVEQCQFHGLYIFKYSQRNGTPASNLLNDVPEDIKTSRFLKLETLQRNIQKSIFEGYVGRSVSVLVEGLSARSVDDLTGHTTCNKVVNFRGSGTLVGSIADVRISEAKTNSLYGTLK
jgi:tRNA-2-methylthio-N6-dimethylallyladenosine synthase